MTEVITVKILDFPNAKGRGMVTQNEDGSYTILINARLSDTDQRKAYRHELRHIKNYDFEKFSVQQIEYDAHRKENGP